MRWGREKPKAALLFVLKPNNLPVLPKKNHWIGTASETLFFFSVSKVQSVMGTSCLIIDIHIPPMIREEVISIANFGTQMTAPIFRFQILLASVSSHKSGEMALCSLYILFYPARFWNLFPPHSFFYSLFECNNWKDK